MPTTKSKLTKVRFIKPVTAAPFFLAYSVGQEGEVNAEMLAKLQAADAVELIGKPAKATRESKTKKETR